jgi:hypothetical protein
MNTDREQEVYITTLLNRLVTKSAWIWRIGTLYVIWTYKVIIDGYEPVRLHMVWSTKLTTKIFCSACSYRVLMFNLTKSFYTFRVHNFLFFIFVLHCIFEWAFGIVLCYEMCIIIIPVTVGIYFLDNCLCCIVTIILYSDWLRIYSYSSLHL